MDEVVKAAGKIDKIADSELSLLDESIARARDRSTIECADRATYEIQLSVKSRDLRKRIRSNVRTE